MLALIFPNFPVAAGHESVYAEVSDSITCRRFCRIGLDAEVPYPDADEAEQLVRWPG
jgi:IS5 family transposase